MDEAAKAPAAKQGVFDELDPAVRIRTKKMMMYFIVFAIVMLFAGLTSAYIVSNMGAYWVHIAPNSTLWMSNIFLALSSLSIFMAYKQMKAGKKQAALGLMGLTFLLGLAFTVSQISGWSALSEKGMGWSITETDLGPAYRWNNIEQITGEYGLDYHVEINGAVLDFQNGEYYSPSDPLKANPITKEVYRNTNNSGAYIWALLWVHIIHLALGLIYLVVNIIRIQKNKINATDNIQLYTNGIYWHFLGILWIYLFVFLFYIH